MTEKLRFKDRVVLVTGGNTGIGRIISRAFCRTGAVTCVNYIAQEDRLHSLVEDASTLPGRMEGIKADVSVEEECREMISHIISCYGRIDVLVNNAGILIPGPISSLAEQDWSRVIRVNLSGAFYCCKESLVYMKKQNSGRIVNISSCLAVKCREGTGAYSVSKAALIGLSRSLSVECRDYDITANTLLLGGVEQAGMLKNIKDNYRVKFQAESSSGKLLNDEEIINMVFFLSDAATRSTNGQSIPLGSPAGQEYLCLPK